MLVYQRVKVLTWDVATAGGDVRRLSHLYIWWSGCGLWKERGGNRKTEVLRFMFFCSCGLRIGWHTIMWLYVPRRAEENLCTHYETLELNLSCGYLSHSHAMEPGTTMNNWDFYESSRWCIIISIHFMRFKHSRFILSSICTWGERSNSSLQIWCAISELWDGAKTKV